MSYKQHNSPFTNYSNPTGTTNNRNVIPDLTQGLVVPNNVTAEGEDENIDATNVNKNADILNQPDDITTAVQNIDAQGSMDSKTKRLHKRANDLNLNPTQRGRARQHELKTKARNERQEKKWDLKNKLTEDKIAKSNPEKLAKIKERQKNTRHKALMNEKINAPGDEKMGNITNPYQDNSLTTSYDESQQTPIDFVPQAGTVDVSDQYPILSGNSSVVNMKKQNNSSMKQINSRGSAFPMVNPDMTDPTIIPPNRAGGAVNTGILEQGASITDPGLKPQSQVAPTQMMGDISSSVGEVNQSMNPMAPGQENTQDQIAQAQENLGTDAATNTPPNTMGSAGMGMHGPAKKDWIGPVTENMDQSKPCTGSKKGGPTCPPGSKKFELANTLLKLSKKRKK